MATHEQKDAEAERAHSARLQVSRVRSTLTALVGTLTVGEEELLREARGILNQLDQSLIRRMLASRKGRDLI